MTAKEARQKAETSDIHEKMRSALKETLEIIKDKSNNGELSVEFIFPHEKIRNYVKSYLTINFYNIEDINYEKFRVTW